MSEQIENRLSVVEEIVVEFADKVEDNTAKIEAIQEGMTGLMSRDEFVQYLMTCYEKFEHLKGLFEGITGLPGGDILVPNRFGDRIAKVEAENAQIRERFVTILEDICWSLGEIQGQISDPIHKTSRLDRLRAEVSERARALRRG